MPLNRSFGKISCHLQVLLERAEVTEIGRQIAFGRFNADRIAARIVPDLISHDFIDSEIACLGMGKIPSANRRRGPHREQFGQADSAGLTISFDGVVGQKHERLAVLAVLEAANFQLGCPGLGICLIEGVL
jgi:hypothetical protein